MKRTFFLILLCLGLAVCGESPALDVAAKHLEDYRQQCKACGNEDDLQELSLQCQYLVSKDAVQAATFPSYYFSKMMCELRLLQITTERTFSVLKAVPSIIQDEVARAEGLSAPSNVSMDSD